MQSVGRLPAGLLGATKPLASQWSIVPRAAGELTVYELLAPDTHQFAIIYDVSATREGDAFYSNPIRPRSIATKERVIDRATGKIKVHNFWAAIDAGLAVQPRNVAAQTEGSIVYALGHVLREKITIKDGRVLESNYTDYEEEDVIEVPEPEEALAEDAATEAGDGEPAETEKPEAATTSTEEA